MPTLLSIPVLWGTQTLAWDVESFVHLWISWLNGLNNELNNELNNDYDLLWFHMIPISSKNRKHAEGERERLLHTHTRKLVQVIVRLPTECGVEKDAA